MRIYTKTESLNKEHLRLLSVKTGKSIKTLKRLKNSHSFLMYTSGSNHYQFMGFSNYLAIVAHQPAKEFFKNIEQLELLRLL